MDRHCYGSRTAPGDGNHAGTNYTRGEHADAGEPGEPRVAAPFADGGTGSRSVTSRYAADSTKYELARLWHPGLSLVAN
jgi:hypothetical protein